MIVLNSNRKKRNNRVVLNMYRKLLESSFQKNFPYAFSEKTNNKKLVELTIVKLITSSRFIESAHRPTIWKFLL
ncbi:hypothetical protein V1477_002938 [Vespula maculifrons]|uniref:Uncharacterized protein n=1 Tax=Vespula maculifrons TaxID=7453 RepID=A0ABD2CXC7_VESMC